MSKTYRRKGAAEACNASYLDYSCTQHTIKEIAKLKAQFHSDSHGEMTTPMWWRHEHSQVPLRRKERDIFKVMLKTVHLDELEAVIFPHWKKPVIYYW